MRPWSDPTTVDAYRSQLHRAGWSLGETGGASSWTVEAHRPGVRILVAAPTQVQAWRLAWVRAQRAEGAREFTSANQGRFLGRS